MCFSARKTSLQEVCCETLTPGVALAYHFRMKPAPSKFGPSQEAIDRAAEDLVSLRRGQVSDDKALAIWPL